MDKYPKEATVRHTVCPQLGDNQAESGKFWTRVWLGKDGVVSVDREKLIKTITAQVTDQLRETHPEVKPESSHFEVIVKLAIEPFSEIAQYDKPNFCKVVFHNGKMDAFDRLWLLQHIDTMIAGRYERDTNPSETPF